MWKWHCTCIYIVYLSACRLNQLILYLQRSNWNIIDFPYLVGKMANTTLRFKAKNQASICCSVRLSTSGKHSSSTKVKISLKLIFIRQNLANLHIGPAVFRNEVRNILSIPSVWNIKQINQINFICMFVKISTNQHPRVRSWPCCLRESEIRRFTTCSLFCRENF